MALEREYATYLARKPDLLAHEGKYVVIHGEVINGPWDTYVDALRYGYEWYSMGSFMVQQVHAVDPVHHI